MIVVHEPIVSMRPTAKIPPPALLLALLVGGASGHTPSCTEAEHQSMRERFTDCRSRYHSRDGSDDICRLLERVVRGCGEVWQECHTPQEIRSLESMHIEPMVAQWRGKERVDARELEDCSLYKQYRLSDSNQEEPALCTDVESTAAMSGFQQCSHTITTPTYQAVLDMTTHHQIARLLCEALANISNTCPNILKECFAPEDVDQMRSLHLVEMKEFLIRIAKNKVTARELDECSAERQRVQETSTWPQQQSTAAGAGGQLSSAAAAAGGQLSSATAVARHVESNSARKTASWPTTTSTSTPPARPHVVVTTTTVRPVVMVRQPGRPQAVSRSYDEDYYDLVEEEDEEADEDTRDKGKPEPPAASGGSSRPYPHKEAVTIGGDDEGDWGRRQQRPASGQARTLASGSAPGTPSASATCGLLALGLMLWRRIL